MTFCPEDKPTDEQISRAMEAIIQGGPKCNMSQAVAMLGTFLRGRIEGMVAGLRPW